MKWTALGGLLLLAGSAAPLPPPFTELFLGPSGLAQVTWVQLADYDGDGDLDLAVEAVDSGSRVSRLYAFDGAAFALDESFLGVIEGPAVFGDYDRDGDLDILFAGVADGGVATYTRLYRNDGAAGFTFVDHGFQGMKGGDAQWADLDNDGDLDVVVIGEGNFVLNDDYVSIYRNDGDGTFSPILDLPGVYLGEISLGDYDRDGDWDIAVTGRSTGARVYRNDGGWRFVDLGLALVPASIASAIEWGDYDGDGDLDFILCGENNGAATLHTEIYRNDGGDVFTPLGAGLPGLRFGEVRWGDVDNDGDLDLLFFGTDYALTPINLVYRNDAGTFVDSGLALAPGDTISSAVWADRDGDGDLDIVLGGNPAAGEAVKIYRNDSSVVNAVPSVPGGLTASLAGDGVQFSWTASDDLETPDVALTYNLRVGTTPGGLEVMAPGSVQANLAWTLRGLAPGTYYYSVQAVDFVHARSAWAVEQSIVVPAAIQVVSATLTPPTLTVTFSRAPDPATVDATSVRLTRGGVPVVPASMSLAGAVLTIQVPGLPGGFYELRVSGTLGPPTPHAGLYAHWPLDEGMGTSTSDASGNGHTGTLVGAGWTSGIFGAAGQFGGGIQRVEVGTGVLPQPWTASMWVKRVDSAGNEATLMDSDAAIVPGTSLRLEQQPPGNRTGVAEYGGQIYRFDYTMPQDEWTHVAFVGVSGVVVLFVNGEHLGARATPMSLYVQRLGGHRALALTGALDEVQVYGRALDVAEVKALAAPAGAVRGTDRRALDGDADGAAGGDWVATFVRTQSVDDTSCGLLGLELLGLVWLLRRRR